MIPGIKSRLLKMILRKLRSYDFDTSEEKKDFVKFMNFYCQHPWKIA